MSDVDPHTRVRASADVHVRAFDGELVVLDLARGDYFGVNEVGARLWAGLIAGHSPAEVAEELSREYDVARETLLADLLALTEDFLRRGLVSLHTPEP